MISRLLSRWTPAISASVRFRESGSSPSAPPNLSYPTRTSAISRPAFSRIRLTTIASPPSAPISKNSGSDDPRVEDVKLMVLGNGRVGKTQLCRNLAGEPFEPESQSTHGVTVETVELSRGRERPRSLCISGISAGRTSTTARMPCSCATTRFSRWSGDQRSRRAIPPRRTRCSAIGRFAIGSIISAISAARTKPSSSYRRAATAPRTTPPAPLQKRTCAPRSRGSGASISARRPRAARRLCARRWSRPPNSRWTAKALPKFPPPGGA